MPIWLDFMPMDGPISIKILPVNLLGATMDSFDFDQKRSVFMEMAEPYLVKYDYLA